ncbi:NAD(P)/FAD-dependent oxidoreductase [Umezawaea sp.]|uniref:NAD(P)/FAD-dependent oxidoreductase n=1 Tax=Umezawaea sp. TaxID=1955258 RepID=UPI002ED32D48
MRRALDEGAQAVVVGAGFIGSEVTSAARGRGLPTTIGEALPAPMARSIGQALASPHERNGTTMACGQEVTAIEGSGRVERFHLADGTSIEADLVVAGIGAAPATEWLAGSGLPIDDGVVCDQHLRAGGADVYAAGDVARWHAPGSARRCGWSTGRTPPSREHGRRGTPCFQPWPSRTGPCFWSDWYGSRIQFAGVADGDEHVVVSGESAGERFVALYRRGDELSGALTLDGQRHIMRCRRLIARGANFDEALALAQTMANRHPTTRS